MMKEFEKRWKNHVGGRDKFMCEKYWRAALRWRLESEFCNVASRQEIEEELQDGNS